MRANERMLIDGFYAEVPLDYAPVIAQMSNPYGLGILVKGRAALSQPRCDVTS